MKFKLNTCVLLVLPFVVMIQSCSGEKQAMLDKYKLIANLASEQKYDLLYEELDDKSKDFVDFLSDTTNFSYPKMKRFGEKNNLSLFTTIYHKHAGDFVLNKGHFFVYLGAVDVSLFSWTEKAKLLEEKAETGDENFVVIAKRANGNKFITSKVQFTRDDNKEWKLDLMSLFLLHEKIYKQSFRKHLRAYGKSVDGDILLHYLNNLRTDEQLDVKFIYDTRRAE